MRGRGCLAVVAIVVAAIAAPFMLPSCGVGERVPCPSSELANGIGTTVPAAEACRDAGYLCVGRPRFQVMRWPLEKGRLVVRVPRPDIEPAAEAERVQRAAMEGILQWSGHPFPIIVDAMRIPTRPWDVRLHWVDGTSFERGGEVSTGLARAEWGEVNGEPRYRVRSISVVARQSDGRGAAEPVSSAAARHIAAHEMGHALGIFHHSDREDDVLVPGGSTLSPVSARDLRTMDALYRLPNGAWVERGGR